MFEEFYEEHSKSEFGNQMERLKKKFVAGWYLDADPTTWQHHFETMDC